MKGRITISFVAVLLIASLAGRGATVEGTVTDSVSKSPIQNVKVTVLNEKKQEVGTPGQTDTTGSYVVKNVPPEAVIEVHFSKNGYVRDPEKQPSKTTKAAVIVDCRLTQHSAPQDKYYQDFAKRLLSLPQGSAEAQELRQHYEALPPKSQAAVRAEIERIRRDDAKGPSR